MASNNWGRIFLALLTCGLLEIAVPSAQAESACQSQVPAPQTSSASALNVSKIITRKRSKGEPDQPSTDKQLEFGETVTVKVEKLSDWIKAGNCAWDLILFLNERPMKGLHPISVDEQYEYLEFLLERRGDDVPTWNELIEKGERKWDWGKVWRRLRVSVGMDGGVAARRDDDARVIMVFLSRSWFFFITGVTIFGFWLLVTLGRKTALLKDTAQGAYSLARSQMALWSWLSLSAYLYLYALSHDPAVEIPLSMLGLLGISAATYLAAVMVDRGSAVGTQAESSLGFIRDISGGKEVSLHRVQMIGWTVLLAVVFVAQVLRALTIPTFDPTLLGLMGLSAGTYVGFKFPENQRAKGDGATKAAGAGG